ncbi:hypothetical protein H8S95_13950 [Pontibacter sp. KCTC 32443]|uniref:hypothetical protein n=1 Tax=Pontibacter TaxID=323449 RepID=UPI00164DD0EE|nr:MULTISPECIES: hypothetical protein [Pontibacter]MBC5775177.1 hypothetical protein [Pontibacter sp. KCTC 32443]
MAKLKTTFPLKKTNHFCSFVKQYKKWKTIKLPAPVAEVVPENKQNVNSLPNEN